MHVYNTPGFCMNRLLGKIKKRKKKNRYRQRPRKGEEAA
jgi:hypothetical protein